MAQKKKATYQVHELTISDAINLAGILSSGGLAGQAQDAIGRLQAMGQGAALDALSRLFMGAFANVNTRDQMRGFLFDLWKTDEDGLANEDDLNVQDRLEPRFQRENGQIVYHENTGEAQFDKSSLYYRKMKRFNKLPPAALVGLLDAIYQSEGFGDFLDSLRDLLSRMNSGGTSGETSTPSSANTVSRIKA